MDYKKLNNIVGWMVFLFATTVYFMTLEPTTSLWDCGEYITTAYKLEVGHPPGAPLFMMLGRLFTIFSSPENAALMVNAMSALSSSFTILFMFWTVTMIAKKVALAPAFNLFSKDNNSNAKPATSLTDGQKWAVLGSGLIGAIAYTFTDSFWFSAVEGEVYAMSSFFTAIVVWAIFKWDNEVAVLDANPEDEDLKGKNPNRWLVFIFFMIGLSIGVHLLNLLCIPAMAYVYYFRKVKNPNVIGFILTGLIGLILLALIQSTIIPNTVSLGSRFELLFVNELGLPFNSGVIFLFVTISAFIIWGVIATQKNEISDRKIVLIIVGISLLSGLLGTSSIFLGIVVAAILMIIFFATYFLTEKNIGLAVLINVLGVLLGIVAWRTWLKDKDPKVLKSGVQRGLNLFFICLGVLYIGYSCFAMVVIRSNANPPLDENNPENLVGLESYLKREQYGDWPILYGPYFNAEAKPGTEWADRSDVYVRRFTVSNRQGKDLKGFKTQEEANAYATLVGGTVSEKYFQSYDGTNGKPTYMDEHCTVFPRMYSPEGRHVIGYKSWSGHKGNKTPTMMENLTYFGSYQVGWMYWRYFMWNFSGRQNDEQGSGNARDGNWISGLNFIDEHHIGDQTNAPALIVDNPGHNEFYMLPLILGLIGFIFMLMKATKEWWVIMLLFLLTGFAIIIYLNQKPYEPRERDYAYAASFYAFSMWIGLSVMAMYDAFKSWTWKDLGLVVAGLMGLGLIFAITDVTASVAMIYMTIVIALVLGVMIGLRKVIKKEMQASIVAILIALPAPIIMGMQGWDDHDRSNRYTARDLAYNYLISCDANAIIYTNGDNDTFPLWYLQEVEGVKTDVRVCNLSLLNTDWYTEQMTRQAYESTPLPISFTEEQYRQNGHRDYLYVLSTNELTMGSTEILPKWQAIIDKKIETNPVEFKTAFKVAVNGVYMILSQTKFPEMKPELYQSLPGFDTTNTYYTFRNLVLNLVSSKSSQEFGISDEQANAIYNTMITFNDAFDYLPGDYAMAYLQDDNNLEDRGRGNLIFFLPAKGLSVPVNRENVLANGIVSEKDADRMVDAIKWKIPKQVIYKADLMILDMVSHFNWERPIYFASSAERSTYLGLNKYFYSEGLVYKLVPIEVTANRNPNSLGEVNTDKMYDNLMSVFKWGNMNEDGVLVDYYTRRLTNNYRVQFSVLADAYIEKMETAQQLVGMLEQIQGQEGDPEQVVNTPLGAFKRSDIPAEIKKNKALIEDCKIKVTAVLDKSFEIMPHSQVPFGRVLPSYITAYYAVGNEEKGRMYAEQSLDLFEEELDYYLDIDPDFSAGLIEDMYASYRSIFSITQACSAYSTDSAFAESMTMRFYNVTERVMLALPKIEKGRPEAYQHIDQTFRNFFQAIGM